MNNNGLGDGAAKAFRTIHLFLAALLVGTNFESCLFLFSPPSYFYMWKFPWNSLKLSNYI